MKLLSIVFLGIVVVFSIGLFDSNLVFAQYTGNVGSEGETGSYTVEEAIDIQKNKSTSENEQVEEESYETRPTNTFVTTDRSSYDEWDVIKIHGGISDYSSDSPIYIIIKNQKGTMVYNSHVLSSNGEFSHDVKVERGLWTTGIHTVIVKHDNETIEFPFRINISDKLSYKKTLDLMDHDVPFSITGGRVNSIESNFESQSIIVNTLTENNGVLTITLPRLLIDATNDGEDDEFFVLVDGNKVDFDEQVSSHDRKLTIEFQTGTYHIEIVGTFLDAGEESIPIAYPPTYYSDTSAVSSNEVNISQGSGTHGCETSHSCYTPFSISVTTGTLVTWNNVDSAAHTVTSGTPEKGPDSRFDSELLYAGGLFSHKFKDPGVHPYFCMVHPWMTGIVHVSGLSQSIPEIIKNTPLDESVNSKTSETYFDLDDSTNNISPRIDEEIEHTSKQFDSQTQGKIKSLDSKISREQSQYDEYLKQYDYYEGKTLSSKDEQKFQTIVKKLNSQNEKVYSLIDERNMVVLESDDVSKGVEGMGNSVQEVRQVEDKQEQISCFLFWCW